MTQATSLPCPKCQLKLQCLCNHVPQCTFSAHIALLMHENECERETNTGRWLLEGVKPTTRHIWQRKAPCPKLIALINDPRYAPYILFPSQDSLAIEQAHSTANKQNKVALFIILDGTWQEAKKMLRKSEWLKTIPTAHITPQRESNYQLRRNQEQGHLCTLEVGAELLSALGNKQQADELCQFFDHYMKVFKADKSGHIYNPDLNN